MGDEQGMDRHGHHDAENSVGRANVPHRRHQRVWRIQPLGIRQRYYSIDLGVHRRSTRDEHRSAALMFVHRDGKPPLLLYLAAGASLDLDIPSTKTLTDSICQSLSTPSGFASASTDAKHRDALFGALRRCYGDWNFEQLQHGFEALYALVRNGRPRTDPAFRVIEAELTCGLHQSFPSPIDEAWLWAAREKFFRVLH